MQHVIFEVLPAPDGREPYLAMAARLKPLLEASGGCLALERFTRTDDAGSASPWMLSMQRWTDAEAMERWRLQGEHCKAQASGRARVFADYRLRVATRLGQHATRVAERQLGAAAPGLDRARASATQRAVAVLEWTGAAPGWDAPAGAQRYRAILDPERHALVTPNLAAAALADWCEGVTQTLTARGVPFALSVAAVERDYGMFERAEAPLARG